MSDAAVRAALRSDSPVVLIDAPAGCGKTHQGAELARDLASGTPGCRPLILTHTHAACSVFAKRTTEMRSKVTIRTIDSLVAEIASEYHTALGLPPDVQRWIREQGKEGHHELCRRVAGLIARRGMIARALAARHAVIVCDEHQDSSATQHEVIMALRVAGSSLRVFADPMQSIFNQAGEGAGIASIWEEWKGQAAHAELDVPHRWKSGSLELGEWALKARESLKAGGRIDLRGKRPSSLRIVFAANIAHGHLDYRLEKEDRQPLDAFVKTQSSLLVLTHFNETAAKLRSFFGRSLPLWEGHTRPALDQLVQSLESAENDPRKVAEAMLTMLEDLGKGLSRSAFGDELIGEVEAGCAKKRKGKPATIQRLARYLLENPDHRGIGKVFSDLWALKETDPQFKEVEVDSVGEFWDVIRLAKYESVADGMIELASRRTYIPSQPPARAISTIHKAKGLECEAVVVLPIDAKSFPDKPEARCLLYVALSRASRELMLVIPRAEKDRSPLLVA